MQIESKLDKMQHMLAVGISPREIMKDLQLTERNYHWYRKKLEDRTFHNYYNKQQESYLEDLEECRIRIQNDWANATAKSRMPDAKAEWGILAVELGMLLFRIKKEGLMAINHYKLRRLEHKTRSLELREQPIIPQGAGESSEDGESDSEGKRKAHLSNYSSSIMPNV
jgi:hypothetical protein